MPFSFYYFFFVLTTWGFKEWEHDVYDIAVNNPLRLGSSSHTKGWDGHGLLNNEGSSHRGPRNQGDGHDYKG